MTDELQNAIEMMVKTPLQKSKATDNLVSILISHMIKEGILDAEKFKHDLSNAKNVFMVSDTESEIPTLEEMTVNIINGCIKDIESISSKED